jgi:hypothetical protein
MFDLEAIFKGNLYSEFVLFWRLIHATRLPRDAGDAHECWLEQYYQQGTEQGGRVRERLRDGVQEALQMLGSGFLAHPESEGLHKKFQSGGLSNTKYYRELLRLIYRLLFLMVAEERRLLFVPDAKIAERQNVYDRWYSVERLRKAVTLSTDHLGSDHRRARVEQERRARRRIVPIDPNRIPVFQRE